MIARMIISRGEPRRKSGLGLMSLRSGPAKAERHEARGHQRREDAVRQDQGRVCRNWGDHAREEVETEENLSDESRNQVAMTR